MPMREPKSVMQTWTMDLTLQQQGVLPTAIRGPDGMPKHCAGKDLIAAFRAAVLNGAFPLQRGAFMGDNTGLPPQGALTAFFGDHDQYPRHWFMHFVHAAEVLGYEHPNSRIRQAWLGVYTEFCRVMHVHPETIEEMRTRLYGDGVGDGRVLTHASDGVDDF